MCFTKVLILENVLDIIITLFCFILIQNQAETSTEASAEIDVPHGTKISGWKLFDEMYDKEHSLNLFKYWIQVSEEFVIGQHELQTTNLAENFIYKQNMT